jgi:polyribonucleotide nucleotidyltransferase
MDFKVAGTADVITAIQLDIKLKGISMAVIEQALKQAGEARAIILEKMAQAITQSRPELNAHAPRMYKLTIDPEKIGAVIGSGGKTIRQITDDTGASIDIENDGSVFVGSPDEASAKKAIKMIEDLIKEVEVGDVYNGKVVRLMGFGAFVEILPGRDGLVHISEMATHRIDKVEDVVKIGDEVTVKVIEIDNQGRINLSIRRLLDDAGEHSSSDSRPLHRNPTPRRDTDPPRRSRPPMNKPRY